MLLLSNPTAKPSLALHTQQLLLPLPLPLLLLLLDLANAKTSTGSVVAHCSVRFKGHPLHTQQRSCCCCPTCHKPMSVPAVLLLSSPTANPSITCSVAASATAAGLARNSTSSAVAVKSKRKAISCHGLARAAHT